MTRARIGMLAMITLLLTGPTPGAVGSCGEEHLGEPAELESYCSQRDQLVCVRRNLRRELTNQETDDCRRAAIERCQSRSWAPECQPTQRQARACLNALQSFDTLSTQESELGECSTGALCAIPAPPPTTPASEPAPASELDAGAEP